MHLIDNPTCDFCNNVNETVNHFLLECPNYRDSRNAMMLNVQNIIQDDIQITSNLLIHGEPDLLSYNQNITIFKAVQKFIIDSGRFTN